MALIILLPYKQRAFCSNILIIPYSDLLTIQKICVHVTIVVEKQ
jgi:hypothetical protein